MCPIMNNYTPNCKVHIITRVFDHMVVSPVLVSVHLSVEVLSVKLSSKTVNSSTQGAFIFLQDESDDRIQETLLVGYDYRDQPHTQSPRGWFLNAWVNHFIWTLVLLSA